MSQRLYRSRSTKIVGGVCGGIAEYFELDPTLVRILTVLLFLLPGIGILTYIIAWILIPLRPYDVEPPVPEHDLSPWNKYLPGIILIGLGVILLVREYWFWFDWDSFWPMVFIIVGAGIILISINKQKKNDSNQHVHHIDGDNGGKVS